MIFRHRYVRLGARLSAIAAAALLCGCIGERDLSTTEPSFYRNLAARTRSSIRRRPSMISGYRANNGLGAGDHRSRS